MEKEDPCLTKQHSHEPDVKAIEVAKGKAAMKEKAKVSREKPGQILATQLTNLPENIRAELGNPESLKRNIRNTQRGTRPKEPATLSELQIQEEWAPTSGEHPFLVYDNGSQSSQRVIVFGSNEGIRHLAMQREWYLDGTFDVAPKFFKQLYIIRAKLGQSAVSCVYALLTRKSQDIYEEFLGAVSQKAEDLGFSFDPEIVHLDFETAAINAVRSTFGPHVLTKGCFYHLTQCTWCKVQELGLSAAYKEDAELKHFCGMIDALAFLPVSDVDDGMAFLKENVPEEVIPLLNYFDSTYVSGSYRSVRRPGENSQCRVRRIPPLFPPSLWNVHDATLTGGDRTNNHCEGWNHAFSKLVGHSHPSIWRLVSHLKEDEAMSSTAIQKESTGEPPQKRTRKTTKYLQKKLLYLCESRSNGEKSIEKFLEGVGHCIRLY